VVLIVLIVAALAFVVFSAVRSKYKKESFFRTTLSTSMDGTLVSYIVLERLGLPVARSYDMLAEGALGEEIPALFLVNPAIPLNGGEIRHLREWVSAGGRLVCTSDCTALLKHLGAGDIASFPYVPFAFADESASTEARSVPEEWQEMPLARDVNEVRFLTSNAFGRTRQHCEGFEPLFADKAGIRIAARNIGMGTLVVLADSSFMANGMVGESDNAVLVANLASYAAADLGEGVIAFDEYHFGNTGRKSGFTELIATLSTSSIGWAVLALTAAGILYMYSHGRQFGTRRSPREARRRSKMEFIESVGATYRASGANRLSFELLYKWFRRKCAISAGLPESAGIYELARKLSFRTGGRESVYAEILGRCEDALTHGKLSVKRFRELVKSLRKIEEDVS
jgi:hypothetical protein